MKKLILLTISIVLFNSCEKQEEPFAEEELLTNEFEEENLNKSSSLYSNLKNSLDFHYVGLADYNRDGHNDAWFVKHSNTRTGYYEVHILDGKRGYNNYLWRRGTILRPIKDAYNFRLGDYNRDRRIDLWACKVKKTGTRKLEIHILDGAKKFASWMTNRVTPYPAFTIDEYLYLDDHNHDGWLDVVIYDDNDSPNNYYSVLDGKASFKTYLVRRAATIGFPH